ncbi:hypothetical protein OCK02_16245 [Rhizobium sp. TRM96647]|uniref:hypothetical protein n=1 Tax=unclassified Rhizobium TaxID=2613769 RepID=UPI001E293DAF|nr:MULTISPECIES: hypothetical protein [unclassified Rhizobium]MCD2181561.1 hypothetical protein [Rhizobium sp. GN54]MCV3737761.1 hypothetical protein [Rhizobium sp. TRM96647]MCV3759509.1 hypothetical protein [Rhizobium sp. TRM96650]
MRHAASLTAFFLSLLVITGCTTSAANNTTYSQYQGPSPDAEIVGMRTGTQNASY